MSKRIEEVLDVLAIIRDGYDKPMTARQLSELRNHAKKSVAAQRGISPKTVQDKYIRQLKPEIDNTSQFETQVASWLEAGSAELQRILAAHASDTDDVHAIDIFFSHPMDDDRLLSEELDLALDEPRFAEGGPKLRIHLQRERNRHLVSEAKRRWLAANCMRCAICKFSFAEVYGECAEGYIQAHHKMPISELQEDTEFTVADLAPLCANCHAIIHVRRPWKTVEELELIVTSRRNVSAV